MKIFNEDSKLSHRIMEYTLNHPKITNQLVWDRKANDCRESRDFSFLYLVYFWNIRTSLKFRFAFILSGHKSEWKLLVIVASDGANKFQINIVDKRSNLASHFSNRPLNENSNQLFVEQTVKRIQKIILKIWTDIIWRVCWNFAELKIKFHRLRCSKRSKITGLRQFLPHPSSTSNGQSKDGWHGIHSEDWCWRKLVQKYYRGQISDKKDRDLSSWLRFSCSTFNSFLLQ